MLEVTSYSNSKKSITEIAQEMYETLLMSSANYMMENLQNASKEEKEQNEKEKSDS